jgi:hypothetical protein
MTPPAHHRKLQGGRRLAVIVLVGAALVGGVVAGLSATGNSRSPGVPTTTVGRRTSSARTSAPSSTPDAATGARGSGPYGVTAGWVAAENAKPGTAAWQITGAPASGGIEGYANLVQAEVGQTATLYVSTAAADFRVDAYRMGYYQGLGGRRVWQSAQVPGRVQAACPVTSGTNTVECDWHPSLEVKLTSAWVQGQYLLKLVGSGGQQCYIPLTVWDPASTAAYVLMSGVLTDEAFNAYGDYDLYQGATPCAPDVYPCSSRSRVVSFDRPDANGNGAGSYLSLMYPLTRFAEEHSLDVTYWTDITLSTEGSLLTNHRVLISPGHDEEWSLEMRQAATAAASHGVNLIFFGASPVLRKVRLQSSPLGADREMVNYRDPQADPLYGIDNAEVTQNWWGQPPASLPDSQLVGADYVGYYDSGSFPLVVSEPSSWLFAGTGLGPGATIPAVLNGDFQAYDPALGGTPPGIEILAHSRVTISGHPDRDYADTTYYTMAGSKAAVFSSGTVGWIPSLQGCAPGASCPARLMQMVTGNLLRVFGAGPVGLRYPSVDNTQQFYG